MANHINRSKDPEVIVNTIIQSCDTEQIQICVMRVPHRLPAGQKDHSEGKPRPVVGDGL